ncbi:hypothetical protein D3C72_2202750 [compost metagenome]
MSGSCAGRHDIQPIGQTSVLISKERDQLCPFGTLDTQPLQERLPGVRVGLELLAAQQ